MELVLHPRYLQHLRLHCRLDLSAVSMLGLPNILSPSRQSEIGNDKVNFNLFFEGVGMGRWLSRAKNVLTLVAVNIYVTLCSRLRFE